MFDDRPGWRINAKAISSPGITSSRFRLRRSALSRSRREFGEVPGASGRPAPMGAPSAPSLISAVRPPPSPEPREGPHEHRP